MKNSINNEDLEINNKSGSSKKRQSDVSVKSSKIKKSNSSSSHQNPSTAATHDDTVC